MKATVFDERRNILGEGPSATGPTNELITWVDIYGKKVRSRHLTSGAVTEYQAVEDVGFAIPRKRWNDAKTEAEFRRQPSLVRNA